jgi:N-acetylmuramoyl-L-alanine amidase
LDQSLSLRASGKRFRYKNQLTHSLLTLTPFGVSSTTHLNWSLRALKKENQFILKCEREIVRPHPQAPLIIIDPGHGGLDPGAIGPHGILEKEMVLELGLRLKDALSSVGFNCLMTRALDSEVFLAPRYDLIDRYKGDLFISLHANSHTNTESSGIETHWRSGVSQKLAQTIQSYLAQELGRSDRGVKLSQDLYVIKHPSVPSVLVETGFISNVQEETLLASKDFQNLFTQALTKSIKVYLTSPKESLIKRPELKIPTQLKSPFKIFEL